MSKKKLRKVPRGMLRVLIKFGLGERLGQKTISSKQYKMIRDYVRSHLDSKKK